MWMGADSRDTTVLEETEPSRHNEEPGQCQAEIVGFGVVRAHVMHFTFGDLPSQIFAQIVI